MDASALRWVLAVIGLAVIAGVYFFTQHQNRMRRRHAYKTMTQDDVEHGDIDDPVLRDELSQISTMLGDDDLKDDVAQIRINPALDASMNRRETYDKPPTLPLIVARIATQDLIAHVLRPSDNRLMTSAELRDAFTHAALGVNQQGLLVDQELVGLRVANLSEQGDFLGLLDDQFTSPGFVCFFNAAENPNPGACYEKMLKKVDELVRMLDLKVFNEDMQLLTLDHVTSTREKLRERTRD